MKIGLKKLFYGTIDRIVIKEGNAYGKLLELCYNVQKLGSTGVCHTDKSGKNWGFCSRSCKIRNKPGQDEPYEEAEFKYFDEAPRGSSFAGSNVFWNS